ncbi:DUF4190 domain-containing protein [Streptomyces sp. NPDC048521]|uniref:DUF4190 domain-containing protein n=1 Tax=Streptomyces sp. NPDC048521 TaxID=3365566 RepID=UPI003723519E
MSDEVPQSTPPEQSTGGVPTSPRVSLDKATTAPAPGRTQDAVQGSVQDAAQVRDAVPAPGRPYAPVQDSIPAAPRDAAVPAQAPGSVVQDQQTLTSLPAAPGVPAEGVPARWAGPAESGAPPANPFAPPADPAPANPYAPPAVPANPYAPPTAPAATGSPFAPPAPPAARHGGTESVPPPPIAPDGPGQVPYGYPGGPSGYGYPGQPGPQPTYGSPYPAPNGYGWPGMQPAPSDGMGTASLVLGILASLGFLLWPVALVLGILAIIFGAIGRGKAGRGEATNPGVALAGLICGATGIVLVLALFAFIIAFRT